MITLLGPTGEFPEGKLNEGDEGELRFAVYRRSGNVILDFGKPLAWVGLPPNTARQLAALLCKGADVLEAEQAAKQSGTRLGGQEGV